MTVPVANVNRGGRRYLPLSSHSVVKLRLTCVSAGVCVCVCLRACVGSLIKIFLFIIYFKQKGTAVSLSPKIIQHNVRAKRVMIVAPTLTPPPTAGTVAEPV